MEHTVKSTGMKVELVKVPYYQIQGIKTKAEKEFRKASEPVDPPYYEIKTAGGGKEKHPHTAETVAKSTSDEVKEKWALHQDCLLRLQQTISIRTFRFALRNGVKVEMPEGGEWEDNQRFDEVDIPDDPREKYYHYVMTEVLKTPSDQKEATQIILEMSTKELIDQEDIEDVEDLFRSDEAEDTRAAESATEENPEG